MSEIFELLLWISFKSMNPSLGFLSSLTLYSFFLFIKRFEVRYRVLVVSDLFSLFFIAECCDWMITPKKNKHEGFQNETRRGILRLDDYTPGFFLTNRQLGHPRY